MPKIDLPKSDWALVYRALESASDAVGFDLQGKVFDAEDIARMEQRQSDYSRIANVILVLFQERPDA